MAPGEAWEVVPFERVGPLSLGIKREEVLGIFGDPEFRVPAEDDDDSIPGSEEWVPDEDDYRAFVVVYDHNDRVLSVECRDLQPVAYQGWTLTLRPADEVKDWARGHRLTTRWSQFHHTLWIPELSLLFFVPNDDTVPAGSITTVQAGRRDYWDLVPEPQDP